MKKVKNSKANLQRQKADIIIETVPLLLRGSQRKELLRYVLRHKKSLLKLFTLVFIQVALELSVLILGRAFLHNRALSFTFEQLFAPLLIICGGIIIYLVVAYHATVLSQEFVIGLVIKLRRDWFITALTSRAFYSQSEKTKIFAKMTYHLALLQAGLLRIVVITPHLLFSITWLVAIVPHTNPELTIILVFWIMSYVILILIGNFISHKYVSREQTLSSHIIRHITQAFFDRDFIDIHKQKASYLEKLDDLSELDLYFRIQRNLWTHGSSVILFVAITLVTALTYAFRPTLAYRVLDNPASFVTSGIILGILIRCSYRSLLLGLSTYPTKLGLCLSLPQQRVTSPRRRTLSFKEITFKAKKVNLDNNKPYFKRVSLNFTQGEKILLYSDSETVLQNITHIITGNSSFFTKPWSVRCDTDWMLYSQWISKNPSITYINPQAHFNKSLLETLTGKPNFSISLEDIEKINEIINEIPEINFVFDKKRGLASNTADPLIGIKQLSLLQLAQVIHNKPSMIVIDQFYTEFNNNEFKNLLSRIIQQMPNLMVLTPTTQRDSTLIPYSKKINLDQFI